MGTSCSHRTRSQIHDSSVSSSGMCPSGPTLHCELWSANSRICSTNTITTNTLSKQLSSQGVLSQCPGRLSATIRQILSVLKSNQLRVVICWFFFNEFEAHSLDSSETVAKFSWRLQFPPLTGCDLLVFLQLIWGIFHRFLRNGGEVFLTSWTSTRYLSNSNRFVCNYTKLSC